MGLDIYFLFPDILNNRRRLGEVGTKIINVKSVCAGPCTYIVYTLCFIYIYVVVVTLTICYRVMRSNVR